MKNKNSTEKEWLAWVELQKSVTLTWLRGDLQGAIQSIDRFVASDPPIDLKRQAIGFRGSLRQEQGDLVGAGSDFLAALSLAEERDFERCSLEESLASVSLQLGDVINAERWYLEALETAAVDPRSSGGAVLLHLLDIRRGSELNTEERLLAERVIKEAWRFHELSGDPELADLRGAAKALAQAECTPGFGHSQ